MARKRVAAPRQTSLDDVWLTFVQVQKGELLDRMLLVILAQWSLQIPPSPCSVSAEEQPKTRMQSHFLLFFLLGFTRYGI